MKTYKDIYKFPLLQNSPGDGKYLSLRITDSKYQFVFQFETYEKEAQIKMLKAINGEKLLTNRELSFRHEDGYIITNKDQKVILIRGWGNLTGVGRHNLSGEEACNIQDTFAEYIVEQLNKRENK